LTPTWRGDLLDGVMEIRGSWADGTPLVAIPNFARNNRLGETGTAPRSGAGDPAIDYSGGATVGTTGNGAGTNAPAAGGPSGRRRFAGGGSMVWIKNE
jgi:hypothetical protein